MKKKLITSLLTVFLFTSINTAQYSIDLQTLQGISSLNLSDFLNFTDLDLERIYSAQLIFTVNIIAPQGEEVWMDGTILWEGPGGTPSGQIVYFKTHPTSARFFTNQDIGKDKKVGIASSQSDSDLLKTAAQEAGKPTGTYTIQLNLYDSENNLQNSDSEQLVFTNPTQTFRVLYPIAGTSVDEGSATASWESVDGAASYKVRGNILLRSSGSLEDAINSANPILNSDVGNITTVNLATIKVRDWSPGQQIAFNVTAVFDDGSSIPSSNIVNFFLYDPEAGSIEDVDKTLEDVVTNLADELGGMGFETQSQVDVLELIRTGQIDILTAQIYDENGNLLSPTELQVLLNFLLSHPDLVLNITFIPN